MSLADRLRELTGLLEQIAEDRRLLDDMPEADRDRLLRAIAYVYSPDRYARRRQSKAETRARKASRAQLHDQLKASAAIRTLHRKPAVTTPNVFAPEGFEPRDVGREADEVHVLVVIWHLPLTHLPVEQRFPVAQSPSLWQVTAHMGSVRKRHPTAGSHSVRALRAMES